MTPRERTVVATPSDDVPSALRKLAALEIDLHPVSLYVYRTRRPRYAAAMKLALLVSALTLVACGGAAQTAPAESPTSTTAATPSPPPEPATAAPEPAPSPSPAPAPSPPAEAVAEKCDGGWVCVKVSLSTRKVEKRETKLMGDPKIESTWSKTSDGRTVSFDEFSKGPLELTLRRGPNGKNEVVVKLAKGGTPIVIDKHDGSTDDFTHVGAIATEQGGALLVDLRYMK